MSIRKHGLVLAVSLAVFGASPFLIEQARAQQQSTQNLVSGLPDFTRLVEQVGPAVVNIEATIKAKPVAQGMDNLPEEFRRFFGPGMMPFPGMPQQRGGTSIGTGFVISSNGDVLTNHHVVEGASQVRVKFSDGRVLNARVVGSDPQSDVALLKVDASGLPTIPLGDSSQVKPGQWAFAMGSPFGLDHSVTAGIVSAVGRTDRGTGQSYVPFIQTDVAINRGNSGGPLMNAQGQVIGINSQIFSNSGGYQGVSFAIPIDTAMAAVKQLKATGKVQRGKLGLRLQEVSPESARALGLPDTRGALVSDVEVGGAAAKAGVQSMDVVRGIDGTTLNSASDLAPIVGAKQPGTEVQLAIWRNGKDIKVPVKLGALTEVTTTETRFGGKAAPNQREAAPKESKLGLELAALDADDRKQLGLKAGEGVGVLSVRGPATEAGMRRGDIVLAVGRTPVGTPQALKAAVAAAGVDGPIMLRVSRNGSPAFVTIQPEVTQ
ncbi:Do family serine endopeptidase [Lysobacter sp. HDW10]|uniref:Do family serine endopeptidase n=1 Tax=Lysobacter sp. HDW10 TaxID=2714936 RepID=UPI001F0D9231|nr:Do family serine endopeptidase [Lysobacter sp. HDW10]